MAQNTEIIAILNSGVSFKRLMWPYFLSALVIASLSFVLSNFVIPHSTERMFEFQKKYVWSPDRSLAVNIHRQVAPGLFVYLDNFAVESNIAYKFSMERFGEEGLEWKLMSEYAQYDTVTGKWNIHNYYTREFTEEGEAVERGAGMDTTIKLAPVDFKRRLEVVEAMDYSRLNEFIDEQIMQGTENVDRYLVVKYQRLMNPLGIFVLTLIGVTVACRKIRGGIGMHIGIGLFLSFSYIMFMQVFNNLSISGGIPPIIGVSIPTVSYLIIGMILYRLAPK
jgi:lipopolysaccharide export system permease protein